MLFLSTMRHTLKYGLSLASLILCSTVKAEPIHFTFGLMAGGTQISHDLYNYSASCKRCGQSTLVPIEEGANNTEYKNDNNAAWSTNSILDHGNHHRPSLGFFIGSNDLIRSRYVNEEHDVTTNFLGFRSGLNRSTINPRTSVTKFSASDINAANAANITIERYVSTLLKRGPFLELILGQERKRWSGHLGLSIEHETFEISSMTSANHDSRWSIHSNQHPHTSYWAPQLDFGFEFPLSKLSRLGLDVMWQYPNQIQITGNEFSPEGASSYTVKAMPSIQTAMLSWIVNLS